MFRYIIIISLLCVLMQAIFAQDPLASGASSATTHRQKAVTITDQQNGADVEVPQGGNLIVQLPGNPTTGYSWTVAGDPSPLRFLKTKNMKKSSSQPSLGAPGIQEFKFAATSAGISTLTLEYRRPWEHDTTPAKTFRVKVNVH